MKSALLSHDSKVGIYSVPDVVADHLEEYCLEFCINWIWKKPNGRKLLQQIGGLDVAVYGAQDFIDYLNRWVFPEQRSELVQQLDFYDYETPEEYRQYPQFNF